VIPGFLVETRRPQLHLAELLLLGAELVRIANLHRHVLAARVFLDVSRVGEGISPGDATMARKTASTNGDAGGQES